MDRMTIFGGGMLGVLLKTLGWVCGVIVWFLVGAASDLAYAYGLWPVGAVLRLVELLLLVGLFGGAVALVFMILNVLYRSVRGGA